MLEGLCEGLLLMMMVNINIYLLTSDSFNSAELPAFREVHVVLETRV